MNYLFVIFFYSIVIDYTLLNMSPEYMWSNSSALSCTVGNRYANPETPGRLVFCHRAAQICIVRKFSYSSNFLLCHQILSRT